MNTQQSCQALTREPLLQELRESEREGEREGGRGGREGGEGGREGGKGEGGGDTSRPSSKREQVNTHWGKRVIPTRSSRKARKFQGGIKYHPPEITSIQSYIIIFYH